jgi:phosphoenolpyruvate synthase/pyruvate phosphate dikinase
MTYINDLAAAGPGDIAVAGGKAVGLGGLIQAGLPVPPGFVLTTAAYSHFVTENNLATAIQQVIVDGDAGTVTIERSAT